MIAACVVLFAVIFSQFAALYIINGEHASPPPASMPAEGPALRDPALSVEVVYRGLEYPTSMAFLAPNDVLVLEKNTGKVLRIVNGSAQPEPVADFEVATLEERGMLGIAVTPGGNSTRVFLYFTESGGVSDGDDASGMVEPSGNRLYRFDLQQQQNGAMHLVNGKRLLDLPASPSAHHNGGKVLVGPDGNVYLTIGDVGGHMTKAQNVKDGPYPDGTSAILRVTQDGEPAANPLSAGDDPLDRYYAYGIRNSFGMDFDPVTGMLWDTENGPEFSDEINLVEPGFNSGWRTVQGMAEDVNPGGDVDDDLVKYPGMNVMENSLAGIISRFLLDIEGKAGRYSDPEFVWADTVAPTALTFLDSPKLGKEYENDMFVGDINNGNLYHFELDEKRTGFVLEEPLNDKTANSVNEIANLVFGSDFGGITDIEVGPDGYLYVLSFHRSEGTMFRIVPNGK